jgi:hypothetical protein
MKSLMDDLKRKKSDSEENNSKTKTFAENWKETSWASLHVGAVIKVEQK